MHARTQAHTQTHPRSVYEVLAPNLHKRVILPGGASGGGLAAVDPLLRMAHTEDILGSEGSADDR